MTDDTYAWALLTAVSAGLLAWAVARVVLAWGGRARRRQLHRERRRMARANT